MRRTSRSQYVAGFHCPRYGYLRYEYASVGLSKVDGGSVPTLGGSAFHAVMKSIAEGQSVEAALQAARAPYATDLASTLPKSHPYFAHILAEQSYVLEAAVRGFMRTRMPAIEQEFELVRAEVNEVWEVGDGVEVVIKADRVERSRSDGLLYIRDFKTTRAADYRWTNKWHHEPQVYIYCDAIQSLLNEEVGGFIVEGICRGSRKEEQGKAPKWKGLRIQQSPLCYGWEKKGDISPKYSSGAERVPLWEVMPAREWVERVLTEEQLVSLFFPTIGPITPSAARLDRYRTQMCAVEKEREEKAIRVNNCIGVGYCEAVDECFPQNLDACDKFGADYPCEFKDLCFNGQVEEDPIGSGIYEPRTDHHEEEE